MATKAAKKKATAARDRAKPKATPRGKQVLRAGVVGVGIGRLHVDGYHRSGRAEVVALCDIKKERAQEVAKAHDVPHIDTDYRRMVKRPDIDAVSVCTPNYLHAEVAIAALRAGKHVICEKPLAMNAAEGEAMVEAARESGKILMVALNNRFRGDTSVLRQFIEARELGDIYYGKTAWLRRSGIPGGWFRLKEQAGGGPLIDLGVHMLDLTWWLMGCPKPVAASGQTYSGLRTRHRDASGVEDLAIALLRFQRKKTIMLEASWATHLDREAMPVQLFGTKGGAALGPLRVFKDMHGTTADISLGFREVNGHMMEMVHFVECCLDGKPVLAPGEDGLAVQKMLDAIYESAEVGREVTIS